MKILVVDDSIVFRSAITQVLQENADLNVFKSVVNGKLAIDMLKLHPDIDLITLDMEMPVMDGLETIKEIRKTNAFVSIIVFSSQTLKGAEKTIQALSAGANDFVTKPNTETSADESLNSIRENLLPKVLVLKNKAKSFKTNSPIIISKNNTDSINLDKNIEYVNLEKLEIPIKPKLILIGTSTGGPEALSSIFRSIKENVSIPMLIVQHMPPLFTEKLAEMLNKMSPVEVREAKNGDFIKPGLCLIAPGDFHMTLKRNGEIELNQNEKVCFVRPSVDVLYESVAQNFGMQILNIVLTGMGEDGANGSGKLLKKGAYTFIQDKDSSIVWGMPGAVSRLLEKDAKIIKLSDIGSLINIVSKRL